MASLDEGASLRVFRIKHRVNRHITSKYDKEWVN